MDNVEDAKGFRPDEPEFDAMTAKFVDQLADGGRAGYLHGGRTGYKDGYSVQDDMGDYAENVGKEAAPGGGFVGDGGNDNNNDDNPPPVIVDGGDGGGTTETVPVSKRTQYGFNFKNMFPGGKPFYGPIGEEEKDEVSKMTTSANTIRNFKDYNNKIKKKGDLAATFAKKEKLFAKGGLAKILEL